MGQGELPISIRAYAETLKVSDKAVRNAIAQGKIKKGVDKKTGKIIVSKADAEWGHLHKVVKPQRGVSKAKVAEKMAKPAAKEPIQKPEKSKIPAEKPVNEPDLPDNPEKTYTYQELIAAIIIYPELSYQETLRRKEILAMAKERMLLEEKEGSLVNKEEVNKALYKMADVIKKSFLNVAARCVPDIRAAANDVEGINILTMEIQTVLKLLAGIKYDPNANNQ